MRSGNGHRLSAKASWVKQKIGIGAGAARSSPFWAAEGRDRGRSHQRRRDRQRRRTSNSPPAVLRTRLDSALAFSDNFRAEDTKGYGGHRAITAARDMPSRRAAQIVYRRLTVCAADETASGGGGGYQRVINPEKTRNCWVLALVATKVADRLRREEQRRGVQRRCLQRHVRVARAGVETVGRRAPARRRSKASAKDCRGSAAPQSTRAVARQGPTDTPVPPATPAHQIRAPRGYKWAAPMILPRQVDRVRRERPPPLRKPKSPRGRSSDRWRGEIFQPKKPSASRANADDQLDDEPIQSRGCVQHAHRSDRADGDQRVAAPVRDARSSSACPAYCARAAFTRNASAWPYNNPRT